VSTPVVDLCGAVWRLLLRSVATELDWCSEGEDQSFMFRMMKDASDNGIDLLYGDDGDREGTVSNGKGKVIAVNHPLYGKVAPLDEHALDILMDTSEWSTMTETIRKFRMFKAVDRRLDDNRQEDYQFTDGEQREDTSFLYQDTK